MAGVRPLKNRQKNQLLSNQLVIYCDTPGYNDKVGAYDAEELFHDKKKTFRATYFWRIRQKTLGDKKILD